MYKFRTKGLSYYFLYFLLTLTLNLTLTLTLTRCVCPTLIDYNDNQGKFVPYFISE